MGKRLSASAILALSTVLTACSDTYEPKPSIMQMKPDHVMTYPASISHSLIFSRKSDVFICTTPAPDANFDQTEEGDFNFSLISVGGSGNDKGGAEAEGSGETEMAGRTPTVLMTRELFFRLCEFSRNYQLDKNEALELYKSTMQAVIDGWKIEAGNTKVSIGDAVTTNQGISEGGALPTLTTNRITPSTTTGTAVPTTAVTTSTTSSDQTSTTSSDQ